MKDWNNDEWQGRDKDRVERNYKVMEYSILFSICVLGLYIISKAITYMFS